MRWQLLSQVATAADDAAGLAISERMRSLVRSYTVASRNAQDGISLAQTAEGALNEVSQILNRMRELAMQSSNGTLASADRTTLDTEFQALIEEIDRISGETEFNGLPLLDGSLATVDIQVGLASGTVRASPCCLCRVLPWTTVCARRRWVSICISSTRCTARA